MTVSYPPIDSAAFLDLDPARVDAALARRGLERDGYVLFLSRVTRAKGIHDLLIAFGRMRCRSRVKLVVAGTGPALEEVRAMAQEDDRVVFLTDVDDNEKPLLMRGCAAYALPTKPEPDFVETFGIALAEKMLAGGGPIITTDTGGTPRRSATPPSSSSPGTSPLWLWPWTGRSWTCQPPSGRTWSFAPAPARWPSTGPRCSTGCSRRRRPPSIVTPPDVSTGCCHTA